MSFRYVAESATDQLALPLTGECISQIAQLSAAGDGDTLRSIGLDGDLTTNRFQVNREAFLNALNQVALSARILPGGFEVKVENFPGNVVTARGASGLIIENINYWIDCSDIYWRIMPMELQGQETNVAAPAGMNGEKRFEEAQIRTDNFGEVTVMKKNRSGHLFTMLKKLIRFVEATKDSEFTLRIE